MVPSHSPVKGKKVSSGQLAHGIDIIPVSSKLGCIWGGGATVEESKPNKENTI